MLCFAKLTVFLSLWVWGMVSRFHCCAVCPSRRRHLEFLMRFLIGWLKPLPSWTWRTIAFIVLQTKAHCVSRFLIGYGPFDLEYFTVNKKLKDAISLLSFSKVTFGFLAFHLKKCWRQFNMINELSRVGKFRDEMKTAKYLSPNYQSESYPLKI